MNDTIEMTPADSAPVSDPPARMEMAMFCTRCGTRNTPDANFCRQCGKKVERPHHAQLDEEDFALLQRPEDRVADLMVVAFRRRESGDLEGAIKACAEALELAPNSTSAHSLMGLLFEAKGEREKAIAEYEKVLELNPGSIADREKLDMLRDGKTDIIRRTIISSRRTPGPVLFENPGSAIAVALAVFLLVLCIGAWAVWTYTQKQTLARSNTGAPVTLGPPGPTPNVTAPLAQSSGAPSQGNPAVQQPSRNPGEMQTADNAITRRPKPTTDEDTPPAQVNLPARDRIEQFNRPTQAQGSDSGTIHLPDTKAQSGGAPTTQSQGNPAATQQARPSASKIEIVVTPEGAPGQSGAAGSGAASTMDSRSRRAIAQQAQLQGNYRVAAREYIKALDGAGDDSAQLHQQIGLCYQRLGESESAVTHYNDAISEYKSLIASGKNVEAAKRGIKACEYGIKASQ